MTDRSNTLAPDEFLTPFTTLGSETGSYALQLQGDGNLVLSANTVPIWHAGKDNQGGCVLLMQGNGDLVLRDDRDNLVWSTDTAGYPGARLVLQDDGNMVLYQGERPIWSTDTPVRIGSGVRSAS